MRIALTFVFVALLATTPAHAYQVDTDPSAVRFFNHVETLNDALDETSALDEYLGPVGICVRQQVVEAAKDVYDDEDGAGRDGGILACFGGDCVSLEPPLDPGTSVKNCKEFVIEVVEYIIGTWGTPVDARALVSVASD